MTTRRWNRICDRWLTIVLIPLIVAAIHHEAGHWQGTLLVIIVILIGGVAVLGLAATIIECSEDVLDWLKGY